MWHRITLLTLALLLLTGHGTPVRPAGTAELWTDHFPSLPSEHVVRIGQSVYCAQQSGLFVYNTRTQSLTKKNKISGLSDVGITALGADTENETLVVGYASGQIDLVHNNRLYPLDALKTQSFYPDKTVRNIACQGQRAYVACDFGIVVLDLRRRALLQTCLIGETGTAVRVNDVTVFRDRLYAATARGIRSISTDSRTLADYALWRTENGLSSPGATFTHIASGSDFMVARQADGSLWRFDGTVWQVLPGNAAWDTGSLIQLDGTPEYFYLTSASGCHVLDSQLHEIAQTTGYTGLSQFSPREITGNPTDGFWIADFRNGLVSWRGGQYRAYAPDGPSLLFSGDMTYAQGVLYAGGGGADSQGNGLGRPGTIHRYVNSRWMDVVSDGLTDFQSVSISGQNPSVWAVSSVDQGVVIYQDASPEYVFTSANSPLAAYGTGKARPGEVRFDRQGNLWVAQTYSSDAPLIARTPSGEWVSFDWSFQGLNGHVFFDRQGHGWAYADLAGLLVFDVNNTLQDPSDDRVVHFNPTNAYTDLLRTVQCIAEDQQGVIWVGTTGGLVLYPDPSSVINGQGLTGSHILVPGIEEPDKVYPLLGSESIRAIAVDGANRKWIGTANAGLFLISADGKRQIHHFTAADSPLPSDEISDICISDQDGMVFINTSGGMVAYRSDATATSSHFGQVYAYPNPVRPEFTGPVTITGLVNGADIRITDISGKLVFHGKATGGQLVWDGKTLRGERPATGVYLIFCSSPDGSETETSKLLFVK